MLRVFPTVTKIKVNFAEGGGRTDLTKGSGIDVELNAGTEHKSVFIIFCT